MALTMAASSPPDVLMEERHGELMIPPSGGNPTQRSAHFLNPTLHFLPSPPSPFSNLIIVSDSKKTLLKSLFQSHRPPPEKWKAWVDRLQPLYQEIWKQAGIYHSILSSTHKIPKDRNLIMGLAERWCVESNTFIFPWGEATLTLEDMAVLGGFSVLGDSVLCPLKTAEAIEIRKSFDDAHRDIRINGTGGVSHQAWMDYFMDTGKKFEHQAFLVFWLSRFVLTKKVCFIGRDLFPVAVHLSFGNPIALAPAVLASIYRDLRLLKRIIVDLSKLRDDDCMDELRTTPLSSPFQLVLLWAWKRFSGDSKLGKRQGTRKWDVVNVREALDSAEECFLWRPYAFASGNFMFSKLYKENGEWVLVDSGKELESYARCLRVSELVGLDCIEQYLPNRVAMQFGFDQEIPGFVTRSNGSFLDAWSNYNRPITDVKLYVPPRLFEADVTLRYLEWYKGSGSTEMEDLFKGVNIAKKKRSTNHRTIPRGSLGGHRDAPLLVPCDGEEGGDFVANLKEAPVNRIELSDSIRVIDSSPVSANLLSRRPHDPEKQASDDVCTLSRAEATAHDALKDHDALAVLGVESSDKENYGGNLICPNMLMLCSQDDYITAEKVKVPHPEGMKESDEKISLGCNAVGKESDGANRCFLKDKMPFAEQVGCKRKSNTSVEAMCIAAECVMRPNLPNVSSSVVTQGDLQQVEFVMETTNMSSKSGRPKNIMAVADLSEKKDSSAEAMCVDAERVLRPHFPNASSSVATYEDFQKAEFVMEHINTSTESVGSPDKRLEEADLSGKKDTMVSTISDEDKGSWDGTTFKLPELEIDVRLSRLERIVAALKAAKREGKFGNMSR